MNPTRVRSSNTSPKSHLGMSIVKVMACKWVVIGIDRAGDTQTSWTFQVCPDRILKVLQGESGLQRVYGILLTVGDVLNIANG